MLPVVTKKGVPGPFCTLWYVAASLRLMWPLAYSQTIGLNSIGGLLITQSM